MYWRDRLSRIAGLSFVRATTKYAAQLCGTSAEHHGG
jgi:hypothetical protein